MSGEQEKEADQTPASATITGGASQPESGASAQSATAQRSENSGETSIDAELLVYVKGVIALMNRRELMHFGLEQRAQSSLSRLNHEELHFLMRFGAYAMHALFFANEKDGPFLHEMREGLIGDVMKFFSYSETEANEACQRVEEMRRNLAASRHGA